MPIAQLDPVTALITIDLQKGIAGMPMAHPAADVLARAGQLTRAFRAKGLPVVLVNVAGMAPGRTDTPRPAFQWPADFAELVPELDAQAGDERVTKRCFGAFLGTDLDTRLKHKGVTQIVLCGIATSIGVESTARSAYDLGYNVALVADAMSDRDAEAHRFTIEKIFPRLGQVDVTENVLKLLK